MEAGPCNCKIHKRGWGTRATNLSTRSHGKRAKCNSMPKETRGPCKDLKQGKQQGQQFYRKRKQPFHKGPTPTAKKPVKAQSNCRSQLTQTPVWNVVTLITDKDFLVLPATFNVRTVIELDISRQDAWPSQKQSTKSTFRKKLTPRMLGKPKMIQTTSTSARYKGNNRHSSRTSKGSASACMLTCHSQPGTTTKNGLTFKPILTQVQMSILCLCQCTSP